MQGRVVLVDAVDVQQAEAMKVPAGRGEGEVPDTGAFPAAVRGLVTSLGDIQPGLTLHGNGASGPGGEEEGLSIIAGALPALRGVQEHVEVRFWREGLFGSEGHETSHLVGSFFGMTPGLGRAGHRAIGAVQGQGPLVGGAMTLAEDRDDPGVQWHACGVIRGHAAHDLERYIGAIRGPHGPGRQEEQKHGQILGNSVTTARSDFSGRRAAMPCPVAVSSRRVGLMRTMSSQISATLPYPMMRRLFVPATGEPRMVTAESLTSPEDRPAFTNRAPWS